MQQRPLAREVLMDVQGKVCLVTGGTSGIGAATALALARKGAQVVAVSRTGAPQESHGLLWSGTSVRFLKADVADPAACRNCVDQVVKDFGRLDVLVHSAGGAVPGGLYTVTDESWMNAFSVHVHSVFHLTRAAAPRMAQQGEGAIILLSSAGGLRGCLGALAYGVAKGALPQFARNLARELADQKIRVNCVSPGVIRTPFQDFLTPEQAANNIQNRIPLHREGRPEDVAELVTSLIENDFITGENIVIDGGMTMRIV
jgi:NAD(P)-dependent dehydrogenase (short-subunit alcohol dehydrogenase family)